ncbi:MAG TPA: ABC transporter permease subunit [Micromonosporaceae bacterium]
MNLAIRSEMLKLRRPRVLFSTIAALWGFAVLVSVLSVATGKDDSTANSTGDLTGTHGATVGFANASRLVGLVILVLFLTSVTSEYSFGTVRILLMRQPRRAVVLGGKLIALLGAMAAGLLGALMLSVAAAAVTMAARGLPMDAWFSSGGLAHVGQAYLNAVIACATYGAFGLAFGVLLRSTVLAVGVMLGWFFMAENIAANTWPDSVHWFPGLLAGAVMSGGTAAVSYWPALAATVGYALAAVLIATTVFTRRDTAA